MIFHRIQRISDAIVTWTFFNITGYFPIIRESTGLRVLISRKYLQMGFQEGNLYSHRSLFSKGPTDNNYPHRTDFGDATFNPWIHIFVSYRRSLGLLVTLRINGWSGSHRFFRICGIWHREQFCDVAFNPLVTGSVNVNNVVGKRVNGFSWNISCAFDVIKGTTA